MKSKKQEMFLKQDSSEWSAEDACAYWPDQREHWTPVSWKDHMYDFNVFYNGIILASGTGNGMNINIPPEDQVFASELRIRFMTNDPAPEPDKKSAVLPTQSACDISLIQLLLPDGRHIASWEKSTAPVYVIEHQILAAPILVKQKQFAHIPGGKPVKRGDEPHFLWVRFEVSDIIEEINSYKNIYACLTVLAPSLLAGMGAFNNINFNYGYGVPAYPVRLVFDGDSKLSRNGYLRHASPFPQDFIGQFVNGKRNRMAIPAGQDNVVVRAVRSQFFASANKHLTHLVITFPARVGARVDFVYPFSPVDDETINKELALGYDGAFTETENFWRKELKTGTSIKVSEPLLSGWIENLPRLTGMIAQKHPATGWYGLVSGSYVYEAVWPTALALQAYALEFLGYGKEVDKYLEPYRLYQGKFKPPSPYLKEHPGYIGAPREISCIDWITDHAAILWAASNHAAMSADKNFIGRWTPAIVKACEFIRDARRTRNHDGFTGILPPAVSNDSGWCSQTAWNNAWHHKALKTASMFLEEIGHPAEKKFRIEADDYKKTFQRQFRAAVAKSKKWRAPDGTLLPFVPPTIACATGEETAHPFNLDTGAMVLVFGELFDASDPIMKAAVRWFREGPQWRLYRRFSSEFQAPVLDHEISSCEPCFSWNIFHSYQLGDREKFTMGLYSLFAAGASRQNFVGCETRNGVFGNCFTYGIALMLMRLAVIAEEEKQLHLLRMVPAAFLTSGGFDWKNVPTCFGPVSISASYQKSTGILEVHWTKPSRSRPKKTILHIPPLPGLQRIFINGKEIKKFCEQIVLDE